MANEIREKLVIDGDQAFDTLDRVGKAAKESLGKQAKGGAKEADKAFEDAKDSAASLAKEIAKLDKKAGLTQAKAGSKDYAASLAALKDAQNALKRPAMEAKRAAKERAAAEKEAAEAVREAAAALKEETKAAEAAAKALHKEATAAERAAVEARELAEANKMTAAKMVVVANQALELGSKLAGATQKMLDFAAAGAIAADAANKFAGLGEAAPALDALTRATASVVDKTKLHQYGVLAERAGLTADQMLGLARTITVAADRHGELANVSEHLNNTLRGELEGLKKIGIFVDLSDKKYEGLTETIKKKRIAVDLSVEGSAAQVAALDSEQLAYTQTQKSVDDMTSSVQELADKLLKATGVIDPFLEKVDTLSGLSDAAAEKSALLGQYISDVGSNVMHAINPMSGFLDMIDVASSVLESTSSWFYRLATGTDEATISVRAHTLALYEQVEAAALLAQDKKRQAKIADDVRNQKAKTAQAFADLKKQASALAGLKAAQDDAASSEKKALDANKETAKSRKDSTEAIEEEDDWTVKLTDHLEEQWAWTLRVADAKAQLHAQEQKEREAVKASGALAGIGAIGAAAAGGGAGAMFGDTDMIKEKEKRVSEALARSRAEAEETAATFAAVGVGLGDIFGQMVAGTFSFTDTVSALLGELLVNVANSLIAWATTEAALLSGNFFLALAGGAAMLAAAGAMKAYSSRGSSGSGSSTAQSQAQRTNDFERQERDNRGTVLEVNLHGIPVPDATARELGDAIERDNLLRGR